uniref:NADH-cytochrome b5 reductase n=1 Tax=Myxobolus squamalis TaxID=59785 RepID=A0A6B2G1X9_MYXSQ
MFRLKFESSDQNLGLPIGKHIKIHCTRGDEEIARSYTPVSLDHDLGHVDLAIRIYFPNEEHTEGGVVSQYVHSLKVGQTVAISGPYGNITYEGYGRFSMKNGEKVTVSKITMIAGGTGITPMLQILRHIWRLKNDKTKIKLIYANKDLGEIMLYGPISEIERNLDKGQLETYHVLKNPPPDFAYGKGRISNEMLISYGWAPSEDTIALCCGRPKINKIMIEKLKEIGYQESQIYCF